MSDFHNCLECGGEIDEKFDYPPYCSECAEDMADNLLAQDQKHIVCKECKTQWEDMDSDEGILVQCPKCRKCYYPEFEKPIHTSGKWQVKIG